jgi:hypothetical protein
MGSDDLFRERKARKAAELKRQNKDRAQTKRYLIVCEGTKTEPYYFNDLAGGLGIRPSSVKIARNNGSSPDRVVAHGIELYEEDAKSGDSFDQVFFVFDKDQHSTYDAAVRQVNDCAATGRPFNAITSVPCFEYWLLLHFGYTAQPFNASGRKSACDNLISVLRKKPGFRDYGKGTQGVYSLVKDKTSAAMTAAKKGLTNAKKTDAQNPSTHIHELIDALQKLGEQGTSI